MRKSRLLSYLTAVAFIFAFVVDASAQQYTVPVQVLVNSPAGIQGEYEYGDPSDYGPQVITTTTGDVEWAYTDSGDSLMCTTGSGDLSGKIALIRRGDCNFTLKIYNAQAQGAIGAIVCNHTYIADGGGIVGMLGGDSATAIVIPSAFLTREDCDLIVAEMNNGTTVNMSFYVPSMYQAFGPYAYSTPMSQILPLDEIQVNLVNTAAVPENGVEAMVSITDPNGVVTTLTESVGTIGSLGDSAVTFDDFTPTVTGYYDMKYSVTTTSGNSNLGQDTVSAQFLITNTSYTLDNLDEDDLLAGGLAPAEQTYLDAFFRYDMGSFYLAGPNGGNATFMSFGLANPDEIPVGDVFSVILYDADPDGDGTVDPNSTYDDWSPIAVAEHTITGSEVSNELIYLGLLDINSGSGIVPLAPNGQYVLMVQYDGTSSGNINPPSFTDAGIINYPYFASYVFTDQLYSGGWASNRQAAIRLHLDGFDAANPELPWVLTGVETVSLDASKFSVSPTLASEEVVVSLDLESVNEKVMINITNTQGMLISSDTYQDVQNNTYSFNVSNYPVGTYFISIGTVEGVVTKTFVVQH